MSSNVLEFENLPKTLKVLESIMKCLKVLEFALILMANKINKLAIEIWSCEITNLFQFKHFTIFLVLEFPDTQPETPQT